MPPRESPTSISSRWVSLLLICLGLLLTKDVADAYAVRRWRPVSEFYNMSVSLIATATATDDYVYGLAFDVGSGKAFGCYVIGSERVVRIDSMNIGTPTILGTATGPRTVTIDTRLVDALYISGGSNRVESMSNPLRPAGQQVITTLAGSGTTGYLPGFGTSAQLPQVECLVIAGRMVNGALVPMLWGTIQNSHVIFSVNINTQQVATYAGTAGVAGNADGHRINTAKLNNPYGLAFNLDRSVMFFTQYSGAYPVLRKIVLDTVVTIVQRSSTGTTSGVLPHPMFPNVTFFSIWSNGVYLHIADDSLWRPFLPATAGTPIYSQVWNSTTYNSYCIALNETDGSILYGTRSNPGTFVRICCLWEDATVEYTDPKDFNAMTVVPILEGRHVAQMTYLPSRNWLVYAHYATGLVWGISANGVQNYITESSGEVIYGVTVHPNGEEVFVAHERDIWRAKIGVNSTRWVGNSSAPDSFVAGFGTSATFGIITLVSAVVNRTLFFSDRSWRILVGANIDTGEISAYACPSMTDAVVDGPRLASSTGCKGIRDVTITTSGVIYMSDYFGNFRKVSDGFVATILNAGYRGETSGIHPYFDLTYFIAEAVPNSVLYFHSGVRNYYFNCSTSGSLTCSNRTTVAAASLSYVDDIFVPTSTQFPNGTYYVAGYVTGIGFKLFQVCCLWKTSKVQYLARQNVTSVNVSVKAEVSGSWRLAYNEYYKAIYLFGSMGLIQHSPSSRIVLSASFDLSVSFPTWDAAGAILYYTASTGLKGISSSGSLVSGGSLLLGQVGSSPFTDGVGSGARMGYGQLARSGAYLYIADRVNSVIGRINLTAAPSSYALNWFACDNTSTGISDGLVYVAQCQNLRSIQVSNDLTTVYFSQAVYLRKIRDGWISTFLNVPAFTQIADVGMVQHPLWDQVVFFANSTNVGVIDASLFSSYALTATPSGPLNTMTGAPLPSVINISGMVLLGDGGEILLTMSVPGLNRTRILRACCLWSGDVATETISQTVSHTVSLTWGSQSVSLSGSLTGGSKSMTFSRSFSLSQSRATRSPSAEVSSSESKSKISSTHSLSDEVSLSHSYSASSSDEITSSSSISTTFSEEVSLSSSGSSTSTRSTSLLPTQSKTVSPLTPTLTFTSTQSWSGSRSPGTHSDTWSFSGSLTPTSSRLPSQSDSLNPTETHTITTAPTRTPPPTHTKSWTDYPCRYPARVPKVLPLGSLPQVTILEMSMRSANLSANITIPFAAGWEANFSVGSLIPRSLVSVSLVVNPEQAPNPSGFRIYPPNVTLILTSNRSFDLAVPQATLGYAIDADEEALVVLHPQYFRLCPPDVDIPMFRIRIKAQADPVAVATQQAIAVVTGTALTVSASSAGSAMDAQSMAVIALMSCAPPSGREAMKNNRLLAPLAVGDSYEAMVIGNIILVVLFGGLHAVVVVAWIKFRHRPRLQSFAQFYFPGLSVGILIMTYQGTAIGALKILGSTTPTAGASYVVAVIGILLTLVTPVVLVLMYRSLVHATYELYDYDNAPENRRFPILRYLFPQGRWNPVEARRCFGPLFSSLRLNHIVWTTIPLWSPSVMVVGAVFRPPSARACQVEFASLAAFQFGLALFHFAARPYRSVFSNVAGGASSFCLGMILAASAVLAMEPQDETAKSLTFAFIQLQTALTLFRMVNRLITYIVEHALLKSVPLRPGHERIGTVSMKKLQGIESSDDEEDESDGDEMSQLQTPMLVAQRTPSDNGSDHSSNEILPRSKTTIRGGTQAFVLTADLLGDDMERVMETAADEAQTHAGTGADADLLRLLDTPIEQGLPDPELQFNLLAAEAEANAPAGVRRDEDGDLSENHLPSVLAGLHCDSDDDDAHEEYDFLTARHSRSRPNVLGRPTTSQLDPAPSPGPVRASNRTTTERPTAAVLDADIL